MATYAKCFYCGQRFDRDKVPFVKVGERRYAHLSCSGEDPEALKQQQEKDAFYQVVKSIYGKNYNYMLINTQAEEYIQKYNYTWSGMKGCLHWFYNIQHGSLEDSNGGIGIIPYIYDEVKEYYQGIYRTQEVNKKKKMKRPPVQFNIQSPRAWQQPPHLLDLEDNDENW